MPAATQGRGVGALATAFYSALALVCFAANSLLCRLALGTQRIDAATFTSIRIASGAVTLLVLLAVTRAPRPSRRGWVAPVMLFVYAAGFSLAYLRMGAATGSLVLFGAVQATMLIAALWSGERFHPLEGVGLCLAIAGLVDLVLPGLHAPPLGAFVLMLVAGLAWGVYSMLGRGSAAPLGDTMRNFLVAVPLAALMSAVTWRGAHVTNSGVTLAVISGALTSGVGYVLWFLALRGLTAIRAATVQLAVPAIAAAGAVAFLKEPLTARLVQAGLLILGGVGLAVFSHARALKRGEPRPSGRTTSRA